MTSSAPHPGDLIRDKIPYGGDYNPEQWPRAVWDEDLAAFKLAHIDTLTIGVFDWALLQPDEDTYDLTVLDEIVETAAGAGKRLVIATATGAMPPWLAHRHPEVCRTDFEGRRHVYGQRHNACPSSPVFRRLSAALADRIAQRYAGHPALVAWHVGNEYGGACYCDTCAAAFREWLRVQHGSLEALNDAWNTTFWSHRFTDWEQIVPPNALSEHWRGPNHTAFQGITLDYLRFTSDAMLANFVDEKAAIRRYDATTPVTTNFMGMYRPIDYHRWAAHLDFASWDNYPPDDRAHARMALTHDLMRGLKDGAPFWLMEQTPTMTASRDVNPVKRPGVMRLWSWQAVAHGADAVLFFQMRQSRGACEKYHGAVLDHAGRTDTRSFREVAALGEELKRLGDAVLGARTPARVALLFDWDSWWAAEITDGLNRHLRYPDVVMAYHRALWQANAGVDVVPVTADLSGYDVVVAPLLHMIKGDVAERLEQVAARGGTVLTTFLSGRVDEHDNAFLADVPGPLASMFGLRVEETDAQPPDVVNPVRLADPDDDAAAGASANAAGASAEAAHAAEAGVVTSEARLTFEVVIPQGAQVIGTYGADFYAGTPAVTRNRVGDGGEAWYVATSLDDAGVEWVVRRILDRHGLVGPYADVEDLELAVRAADDGTRTAFLLHHGREPVDVTLHAAGTDLLTGQEYAHGQTVHLEPTDVLVIQERPESS
ncbi:beta-galactosidase [Phytoactinopolyspora halotolerans]|uniref:Beta-galactosidase n=1 Tax=Phytoactinopolyspora halotolerans TaxID=1981512 RepID=A0A6L9S665_9ACTN|nr:beta-galactosidase [Phytoactinopolyspora halotolerans]NED99539.1 beta-galactosidase [Phytoactinopolyspora halotolerans]